MTAKQNLFTSKTAMGIYATLVLAAMPTLNKWTVQEKPPTFGEIVQVILLLASSGATMMGRYGANETTFTPGFVPGRNEEDVKEADQS